MPICVYRRTLAAQAVRQEGQCQEGEEREVEEERREVGCSTSTVEGSGVEGWVRAGQQWKMKMALESTRVFCGGSA